MKNVSRKVALSFLAVSALQSSVTINQPVKVRAHELVQNQSMEILNIEDLNQFFGDVIDGSKEITKLIEGDSITFIIPEKDYGITNRCASCFDTTITQVSSATYREKHLSTLVTSSVWSTASNAVRPTITASTNANMSVSFRGSNGTGTVSVTATAGFGVSQTWTAQPNVPGNRVSLGIFGTTVTIARQRIRFYARATGRFSHSEYRNSVTINTPYVGRWYRR
ncbi:MAG: hypothetical protein FWF59_14395 [Turicibacter sp.]|nr:hypothetical protein [Turicibacter sp.]